MALPQPRFCWGSCSWENEEQAHPSSMSPPCSRLKDWWLIPHPSSLRLHFGPQTELISSSAYSLTHPKENHGHKKPLPSQHKSTIEGKKGKKEENEGDSPEGEIGRITCVFSRAMTEKRVNFPQIADIVFRWLLSSCWVVCEQHQLPVHLSSEGKSAHYPAQARCSSLSLSLESLVTFR